MPETIQPQELTHRKRPALLTLFCILSFISNGLMIAIGITGIFSSSYIANIMETYAPGGGALGSQLLFMGSFMILLIFGL